MAIILPLAIPFATELSPSDYGYLVVSTSAVLTGAIFGDHCSPISDTTILSATSARCGLLETCGDAAELRALGDRYNDMLRIPSLGIRLFRLGGECPGAVGDRRFALYLWAQGSERYRIKRGC